MKDYQKIIYSTIQNTFFVETKTKSLMFDSMKDVINGLDIDDDTDIEVTIVRYY